MASVVFRCESTEESDVLRNAVNRYGRIVLQPQGVDLRNYAPANSEGAGFGWEAVQQAARDMHNGSVSWMSIRMAEAIREALVSRAEANETYAPAPLAEKLAARMAACIKWAQDKTNPASLEEFKVQDGPLKGAFRQTLQTLRLNLQQAAYLATPGAPVKSYGPEGMQFRPNSEFEAAAFRNQFAAYARELSLRDPEGFAGWEKAYLEWRGTKNPDTFPRVESYARKNG